MAKLELFSRLLPVLAMGGASALTLAYWWLLRPPHHPRNIPAVPFWVVLLPFIYDVDQEETYRNYIEGPLHKFGAVKIFFGGQWNLLVQRPSLLSEVFKDEETYQKSGNQKKIPHTVLAEFLGSHTFSPVCMFPG
jgi:unspecific monooxygenase